VVVLDNKKEQLRAGQYAMASVVIADPTERLVLPVTAIGNTAGQDHVWTIEDGALLRRAVTTGRRDEAGGRVEVLKGVAADTVVLAARFDNLREGTKALVAAKAVPVASTPGASNLK
jgi:hypothetical protein